MRTAKLRRASAARRKAPGVVGSFAVTARSTVVSDALAHACREDPELVAVLGDRPPGDLDPLFLEDVDDRLVGERTPRVLFRDELLDPGLDPACADVLAG